MKPENEEMEEESPPVFGSWRRIYWFVGAFFVVEVAVFYLLTLFYR